MADEEAEQFPQLRALIPAEGLVSLGAKVETATKLAPTHPHAPRSELFRRPSGGASG